MQDDIELVREKVDLVELVRQYTPLTQTGRNFKGLCPFHTEKTPSFFVRPDKGMYYCFGCQRGGDLYTFVMEKENITFGEALELLAKRAGVTLTQTRDASRGQKKERILHVLSAANEFFRQQLSTSEGAKAREYLLARGLTEATITAFQLGYAPDSWDATSTYLLKNGYRQEEIIDAGLAIVSSKSRAGAYDRFRGRVMFPIIDHLGRIVGFSGRTLESSEQAKYINSPETVVFSKGSVLYGYDKAHETARKKDYTILVEGNLDVISLHQAGITNVVAPLGTGFTSQQLKLLARVSPRLMIVFDADDAGVLAAQRAAIEAATEGFEVKVATLRSGKDPDEAVKSNFEQFKRDLADAQSAFIFFLIRARKQFPGQSSYDFKQVAQYVFPFIQAISDNTVREQTLEQLSRELSLTFVALEKDYATWTQQTMTKHTGSTPSGSAQEKEQPLSRQERMEEYMLSLLYNVPERVLSDQTLRQRLTAFPHVAFTQERYRNMFEKIVHAIQNGNFNLTDTIQSTAEEMQQTTKSLLLRDFGALLDTDELALRELTKTIRLLEEAYFRRRIRDLSRKKDSLVEGSEEITAINEEIRAMTQQLRETNQ